MGNILRVKKNNIAQFLVYPYVANGVLKALGKSVYIIDYFDWLRTVAMFSDSHSMLNENLVHINSIDNYKELYHKVSTCMNICSKPLTLEDINYLSTMPEVLKALLYGYEDFVKEMEVVQKVYLSRFTQNLNNNLPYLIIPFSFGLNKLATSHIEFKELYPKDLDIRFECGNLKDSCRRMPLGKNLFEFEIITYSCNASNLNEDNLMPSDWTLFSKDEDFEKKRKQATYIEKMNYIKDIYSQYKYVGLSHIENKGTSFLMNYPFMQPCLQQPASVFNGDTPVFIPINDIILKGKITCPIVNDISFYKELACS